MDGSARRLISARATAGVKHRLTGCSRRSRVSVIVVLMTLFYLPPQGIEYYSAQANENGLQPRQPSSPIVACQRHKRFCRRHPQFSSTKRLHHFMMIAINSLAVLALVSKQRLLFLVAGGRDVHVGGWHEAERFAAAIDFKKIEEPSRPPRQVAANGQHP